MMITLRNIRDSGVALAIYSYEPRLLIRLDQVNHNRITIIMFDKIRRIPIYQITLYKRTALTHTRRIPTVHIQ